VFGMSIAEMILIGGIALLILGPEKLPDMAVKLGRWLRELRVASAELRNEFRSEFDFDEWPGESRGGTSPPRLDDPAEAAPKRTGGFGNPVRKLPEQPSAPDEHA